MTFGKLCLSVEKPTVDESNGLDGKGAGGCGYDDAGVSYAGYGVGHDAGDGNDDDGGGGMK